MSHAAIIDRSSRVRQAVAAARTVTGRTVGFRRRALRRRLADLQARRPDPIVAVASYYLSLGTVPRSLWDGGG